MKRIVLILFAALALLGLVGWYVIDRLLPPPAIEAVLAPEHQRIAARFLDALDAEQYADALALCTDEMRSKLDEERLHTIWQALPAQLGARAPRGPLRGAVIGDQPAAVAALPFAKFTLDARIVFDDANRIAGFRIVPSQAVAIAGEIESNARWHEVEAVVGEGAGALPATLTLPREAARPPVVVLVHGSGPHDRDETIGPNKPFRDLAHGLAERGIAVLRYAKRTAVHPDEFASGDFTVDEETTRDALAAVAMLRGRGDVDPARIFVAGHSLGAMMAPRIAARDPAIAGLVLLAPPALRLEDTVVRQVRYLASGGGDAATAARIAELEAQRDAVRGLDAAALPQGPMMLGLPARYWLDLDGYDPVAAARSIVQPLLLLQGGRDYQVTMADDFVRWRDAFADDPRVTFVEYPRLGHLFMPAGDPPGPADYDQPGHVDARVFDDIAAWLRVQAAAER